MRGSVSGSLIRSTLKEKILVFKINVELKVQKIVKMPK